MGISGCVRGGRGLLCVSAKEIKIKHEHSSDAYPSQVLPFPQQKLNVADHDVGINKGRRAATSLTTQEDADLPLAIKNGDYVINLGFGTAQQSLYTLLDTGSDISWIPCDSGSMFDPSNSSTFQYLSCSSETCQA
ncbi:hypothetical protein SUGI_0824130 [Cryptomeria japonica]|nr:hypothetical protein SUGI_0824130 [Cryptomeria japonica]